MKENMKALTEQIKEASKDFYKKMVFKQIEKAYYTYSINRNEITLPLMRANGRHFVYILRKNEDVIYVGRTKRIYDRLVTHKSKKDFDKVALIEYLDQGQSRDAEYYLIKYYKPALNKVWVTTGLNKYDSI
jgi:hypothetical protein